MKRSTVILLLLVFFGSAAFWLISKKPWRTSAKEADEIAVKDTAAVTKIFMANKNGIKILLERSINNIWIINGKTPVDVTKINLLLSTLHDMRIQKPLPASMHNTAVGILASKGIKTEIYFGDKLVKTLYVGTETPERTGTFMLIEGEDEPYDVHIPGFVGYLTPRFILNEIKWYSKFVFDEDFKTINSLKVTYPANPENSFIYERNIYSARNYISDATGNLMEADTQYVKFYLSGYKNLYVEGYYEEDVFPQHARDSLLNLVPYCEVVLINSARLKTTLKVFNKPIGDRSRQQFDENNMPLKIDPEKYFALINNKPIVASIQDYNFGRIFKKLTDFKKRKY
ncbi:MAG: hypothetical protein H7296_03160 [Bacteroidia bacterium]|nr:hypothetical protein [Bacteroidia bacterium]